MDGWSFLLVQSQHFGTTQGNLSGKRTFNGMGFLACFVISLTFSVFVLNAIVRGSASRSILMWQQQCKITTSLIVFDVRTSLTLACSFNIKPNCRMACYLWWIHLVNICICPLCFSKYATANNIIECLTYIFKWSLRSLLLVSCKDVFSLLFYHGAYSSPNVFSITSCVLSFKSFLVLWVSSLVSFHFKPGRFLYVLF